MNTSRLLTASLLGLGLALALVGLWGANHAAAAPTATYYVDTLTDGADGECATDCSLREAVIAANNNPGADVISLTVAGTYSLTIPGPNEAAAATGDLDITEDLTILGQGPSATIIDANGIDRVLSLNAGTVVISGVTIMGGLPPTGGGGGISNNDTDLSLTNVAVVSNSAVLYGGAGGGIRLQGTDAALTMDESSILARNTAYGGGGLAVVDGARVTLSAGRIVSNTGDPFGGGVIVSGAAFTQTGASTITHNAANEGGGVYVTSGGSAVMNGGQIVSNTADYGGGVYVNTGSATLNGGQILSNTARYRGGGVYLYSGSAVCTQTAGLIAYNVVTDTGPVDGGGGVYVRSGRASLSGGQVMGNQAVHGGGVYINTPQATLIQTGDSGIDENTATLDGGGVYIYAGRATLSGGQIRDNTTGQNGGGVYASSGQAALSGGQILSNTASESGGGVCLYNGGAAFTQTAGLIAYNTAEGTDDADGGGGIYSRYGSNRVTLSGGQVLGNQAGRGGGLYIRLGTVTMLGWYIVDNDASYGGGVYAGTVGWSVPLTGGQIISNTATKNGGGLYTAAGSVTMERGQIIDNYATNGGGVYVNNGSIGGSAVFEGTQIVSNTTAAGGNGGGIHVASGDATVRRGQIVGNTATNGGGVYRNNGSLTLINTTVSGNYALDGGAIFDNSNGPIVLTHTTVASNTGSGGSGINSGPGAIRTNNTIIAYNGTENCDSNLSVTSNDHNLDDDGTCMLGELNDKSGVDPQLAPLAYDRGTLVHAIAPGTPAHDAGACQASITTDQRGLPRILPCDMGAYEYVHAQVHLPLVLRDY